MTSKKTERLGTNPPWTGSKYSKLRNNGFLDGTLNTNKFKFQPLKCARGGEACRCKFEEGCILCKKLLLLDVWIDSWSEMFVNLNQEDLIPRWPLGGGEISVQCQKGGSFRFYPCRGYGSFLERPNAEKNFFHKQHFCNSQPNRWRVNILSMRLLS